MWVGQQNNGLGEAMREASQPRRNAAAAGLGPLPAALRLGRSG